MLIERRLQGRELSSGAPQTPLPCPFPGENFWGQRDIPGLKQLHGYLSDRTEPAPIVAREGFSTDFKRRWSGATLCVMRIRECA